MVIGLNNQIGAKSRHWHISSRARSESMSQFSDFVTAAVMGANPGIDQSALWKKFLHHKMGIGDNEGYLDY